MIYLSKGTISKDKKPRKRTILEDGDFNMFSLCMNIFKGNFREKEVMKITLTKKRVSISLLNVELLNIFFNNKDTESGSYKQLQKLVQAGLQQQEE